MANIDIAFGWVAQPELDVPALNSPRPCSHGARCNYNGCCAFVHPGEQGTGRRVFPARNANEKDVVRLIGRPDFYERRRLRLSWPQWCAKKGLPLPPVRKAAAAVPADAAEREVTARATMTQIMVERGLMASISAFLAVVSEDMKAAGVPVHEVSFYASRMLGKHGPAACLAILADQEKMKETMATIAEEASAPASALTADAPPFVPQAAALAAAPSALTPTPSALAAAPSALAAAPSALAAAPSGAADEAPESRTWAQRV